jgi:hypothetical protein
MLILYKKSTGEVLDNSGTSSLWPEGPPIPEEPDAPEVAPIEGETKAELAARRAAAHEELLDPYRAELEEALARVYVNTDRAGLDRKKIGLLRLHDERDAQVIASITGPVSYKVDPKTKTVVVLGAAPVETDPVDAARGRIRALKAKGPKHLTPAERDEALVLLLELVV